jgi:NADH dehydrogenase
VHLAASTRDEPSGTIEEICTLATLRMVQAAQRMDIDHFLFFSALGATPHHRVRLFRAKAVAERIVAEAPLRTTVIAPSVVYEPGDRWLTLVERLAWGPVAPVPGSGRSRCQPIWAQDLADCVLAALAQGGAPSAGGQPAGVASRDGSRRYELAGPETLTYNQMVHAILSASGHERRLAHLPPGLAERALRLLERAMGPQTPVTWDEAQLLEAECVSARGPADALALGCQPERMGVVLGLG